MIIKDKEGWEIAFSQPSFALWKIASHTAKNAVRVYVSGLFISLIYLLNEVSCGILKGNNYVNSTGKRRSLCSGIYHLTFVRS